MRDMHPPATNMQRRACDAHNSASAGGCAVARDEYSGTAALPALRIAFAGSGSACPAPPLYRRTPPCRTPFRSPPSSASTGRTRRTTSAFGLPTPPSASAPSSPTPRRHSVTGPTSSAPDLPALPSPSASRLRATSASTAELGSVRLPRCPAPAPNSRRRYPEPRHGVEALRPWPLPRVF
jgi:hypothetical protein